MLFYEYFHGDNGAGIGANHQTGWTGAVAKLVQQYGEYHMQQKAPEVIDLVLDKAKTRDRKKGIEYKKTG